MKIVKGFLGGLSVGAALLTLVSYICYKIAFGVPKKCADPYYGLGKKEFKQYKHNIYDMIETVIKIPYEDVYTVSEDGLRLHAQYYETDSNAPVEILCHGYHGTGYRDFCGGLQLALRRGHNVLLIDQRAHGKSEGKCLTFGIKERKDCISWVNYMIDRLGTDTKIILAGISMGAATVMMATELELPENVVAVIADCGYSSPEKIIRKVMKEAGYPQSLFPILNLGAKWFGGFDIKEAAPGEALKHGQIPVLFIHGEADDFVPCDMTIENYEVCAAKKELVTVPGAGHGLSYLVDLEAYTDAVDKFLKEV